MNIPALSLVVLLAASNASTASAQISSVFGDSRRVRRIKDDSSSRQQRARQMRKLVDAMSVQPDPVPVPTTATITGVRPSLRGQRRVISIGILRSITNGTHAQIAQVTFGTSTV